MKVFDCLVSFLTDSLVHLRGLSSVRDCYHFGVTGDMPFRVETPNISNYSHSMKKSLCLCTLFIILLISTPECFSLSTDLARDAQTTKLLLVDVNSSICVTPTNHTSSRSHMLLDNKHDIIMDWTPKAACTMMVEMFWDQMGIKNGLHYPKNSFIHSYRQNFYRVCGMVKSSLMSSTDYYKFKVVRNPYSRAVSSYIHVMKQLVHDLGSMLSGKDQVEDYNNLSFEQFLDLYIEKVRPLVNDGKLVNGVTYHVEMQATPEEIHQFARQRPSSPFNRIVHLETFDSDIVLVNSDTKLNYSFPNHEDFHVVKKIKHADVYFGNMGYQELSAIGIPEDYGKFYNRKTKKQVAKLFYHDLKIYNYSFPFTKLYI